MAEELREEIERIKPLADAVVDAATTLNAAIEAACDQGLSVGIDVLARPLDDGEVIPAVRARISKRIA